MKEIEIKVPVMGESGVMVEKAFTSILELRDFAKESKEFLNFNKEHVQSMVAGIVQEAKSVNVDSDTFKGVAKDTEQKLRHLRYTCKAVKDNNISILNRNKNDESVLWDSAIKLIAEEENRLKLGIDAEKKKIADAKKAKEEEEQRKRDELLKSIDSVVTNLDIILIDARDNESLDNYNLNLNLFEDRVDNGDFGEMKSIAIRKLAEYTGKREVITNRIELDRQKAENERLKKEAEERQKEEDKKKFISSLRNSISTQINEVSTIEELNMIETRVINLDQEVETSDFDFSIVEIQEEMYNLIPDAKKRIDEVLAKKGKEAERKALLFDIRKKQLLELGFTQSAISLKHPLVSPISFDELQSYDELDYINAIELLKRNIKTAEEKQAKKLKEEKDAFEKDFQILADKYKGLGGDVRHIRDDINHKSGINTLKSRISRIETKNKEKERLSIGTELSLFEGEIEEFVTRLELIVEETKFINERSKEEINKLLDTIKKESDNTFNQFK